MNISIPIPGLLESNTSGTETEFVFGPYAPGYAITMGTCIRRCLLSSVPAAGITAILIEGVTHKFAVIPGMKEELIIFIENLKKVNFKFLVPGMNRATVKLEVPHSAVVTSKMIQCNPDSVKVLDDVYLCTFHSSELKEVFKCEIFLEEGRGYVDSTPITDEIVSDAIRVNNSLNAVRRVALDVEQVRYGERTDYEVLKIRMKTIGITASEALDKAARILQEQLAVFAKDSSLKMSGRDSLSATNLNLNKPLKEMVLSEKTVLALEQFGIKTAGDLSRCTESHLLSIPRLGARKIEDIKEALGAVGLSLKDVSIVKEDN